MAPIRVAIIGLSSVTGNISASPGDGWAASAHLPYLLQSPHYEVVALCNTSVQSAQKAIARHGLPSSTKAYGSSSDLAQDPDVDLVLCSVRVDLHHKLMLPVLQAGKDAFVEWPLASNLHDAEDLLAAAQKSGSKTIVGLQARNSPFVQKVKELVKSKTIGDLLSSITVCTTGYGDGVEPPGVDYMTKKAVGGNLLTIQGGHLIDSVLHALGPLDDVSAQLTTRWKETKLLHPDGLFKEIIPRETPDHINLQGVLANNDAPITIAIRSGKGFPDTPNLTWRVFGSKGEIRVTANANISVALGGEKIELYDHEKGEVEVIEVAYADEVKDLPPFAKNIGKLYELFATGGDLDKGFVDFEQAVGMHRVVDKIEKSSERKRAEKIEK